MTVSGLSCAFVARIWKMTAVFHVMLYVKLTGRYCGGINNIEELCLN